MTFIEGCAVTLAEIAKAAGRPVAEIETEARRLQISSVAIGLAVQPCLPSTRTA